MKIRQTVPLALALIPLVSAAKKETRPNVIFILTDDHRWDAMGCAGNPIIQTPNLDALAGEGTLFSNACVTTSISCVSRASILTGQHQGAHGIVDFNKPMNADQLSNIYPVLLRSAGYYTGFIGKYGVGADKTFPVDAYDFWRVFPGQGWYWENGVEGRGEHLTVTQGRQVIEFLRQRDKDKPFCLSVSFKAPHCQDEARNAGGEEFPAEPRDEQLYRDVTIPYPATRGDEYWMAFPEAFRYSGPKKLENEARVRWRYRFATDSMYQATVKKYYRLITGVDRQVGLMMDELRRQGLDGNTVVIFMGDNGYYLAEHGMAGKWFFHRESVRVPMIVRDPRVKKVGRGRVCDRMALNIDIAPTILDAAGVDVPARMQGASLLPLCRGEKPAWREDFYYEYSYDPKNVHLPASQGLIGSHYTYARYIFDGRQWAELYDLHTDPHQMRNLASDPAWAAVLRQMEARTEELARQAHTPAQ